MSETREDRLVWALRLIESQDQGAGGTVTEAEAWRSAQQIAKRALREYAEATPEPPTPERPAARCVWRAFDAERLQPKWYRPNCTRALSVELSHLSAWNWCPYCGKPLSVEEDIHATE